LREIEDGAGTQFDPDIAQAFIRHMRHREQDQRPAA
jgi:HD-GYP domain-containing protein (c-di-GMP phosphodiesterase class II)